MPARLVFAALLAALVAGCADGTPRDGDASAPDRLRVVATTNLVADLARSVGGPDVAVTALMGPGVDPHLYRATERDAERLAGADLILANGLHLEGKMGTVLERLGERTVAVAAAVPRERLRSPPGFDGAPDPHVWMDAGLWRYAAQATADAFARADPAHAPAYRARLAATLAAYDTLDADLRRLLSAVPPARRVLVTGHDAFGYFGRAYGFRVAALQGLSTATEAGAADVSALAARVAAARLPALFVETSLSPRAMQAVRAAVRARGYDVVVGGTLYTDALGGPGSGAATYPAMMRANARTIAEALSEGSHGRRTSCDGRCGGGRDPRAALVPTARAPIPREGLPARRVRPPRSTPTSSILHRTSSIPPPRPCPRRLPSKSTT